MKILKTVFIGVCFLSSSFVNAEIPVVDLNDSQTHKDHPLVNNYGLSKMHYNPHLSVDGRINRLEQQIAYLEQLQLSSRVDQLQAMVQDLRGLIEVQGHQLQELQKQQRDLYADLDRRLSGVGQKSDSTEIESSIKSKEEAVSDEEIKAYEAGITLIKSKQYSKAVAKLKNYLHRYPQGQYVVNTHYWLGELFVISGDTKLAEKEFNTVSNDYVLSEKVPDSLLKLGIIAYDQSNFREARLKWKTLVQKYPDSSAARVAKVRLEQLQKQGV